MSHPLIKGSGDPLASPRCQVSKKKRTGTDEDSTSMEVQVPSNKDLELAPGLVVGNVPDDTAVEGSVSRSGPEEVIDKVSTVRTHFHENPFNAAGNYAESSSYDIKTVLSVDVNSRVCEELLGYCPKSASFEISGSEKGTMSEASSGDDNDDEAYAQVEKRQCLSS